MTEFAERCAECRFFIQDNGGMFCRRWPPTAFLVMATPSVLSAPQHQQPQPVPMSAYPPVQRNGWCGEYQRRPEGNA